MNGIPEASYMSKAKNELASRQKERLDLSKYGLIAHKVACIQPRLPIT